MKIHLHASAAILYTAYVFMCCGAIASEDGSGSLALVQAKPIQIELQPWQKRRIEFFKIAKGVRNGNPVSAKEFDAILTEFETRPFSRTPIENLEIIGTYYLPKDGIEECLSMIVANSVLGWYDALRFASESGRAEILNNEMFFKKAYVIGGPEVTAKVTTFLGNPKQAASAITLGFQYAEKVRGTTAYDRRWPTGYGLERLNCAMGSSPCVAPPGLPKEQWGQAWEEAKQRVASYYRQTNLPVANTNTVK